LLADVAGAQSPFDGLRFRAIGPAAIGGRIHDVESLPDDPSTIWIASASGGIWKSANHGTTWEPVFDKEAVSALGDLAIFAGDPNIVWAGTGEQNNRQSSSYGHGVYRTTNGGKSWDHLGLEETRHIARVLTHPTDVNVAWVAAAGNLWRANAERGVYKTTDAGKTWKKVLYVDSLTGATDMVMDPSDPNTVIVATYQRLRRTWGFNGGGPGSGLYKTSDGGATWKKLTAGIPGGDKGRIGLAISRSTPKVVMATIEHPTEGGTYRSEDGGETWTRVSRLNPRPMYYSKIHIDPTSDKRVYILGVTNSRSDDGGKTFRNISNSPTYDVGLKTDHHALWIDPRHPKHLLIGGDGGLHESWDMGETYRRINNIPIGQFYAIGLDDRDPYWIYGGMQDNHSWMGPSRTRHWLGIGNEDWRQIGFGDGMFQQPDPFDSRHVYTSSQNAGIQRFDVETGDRLDIKPQPPAGDSAYRFDWTAPILASRHRAGLVYLGGNRLFITRDRGVTWTHTKDLTRQLNRDTLEIMGVAGRNVTISRNDGEQAFGEITSISESPLDVQTLWTGTDDGNVQVSRDGGATWTEVSERISGVPNGTYVSRVVASAAGRGVAFVSFDAHRDGDFRPYLFRTEDFGRTWTKVTAGLPAMGSVRTVYELPTKPNVVLAGTEHALYVSTDAGQNWTRWASNLPTTQYHDVVLHRRSGDLVIGTHGRSIWILDDASPLGEWSNSVAAARLHLFSIRATRLVQPWQDFSNTAQGEFFGENPLDGALVSYHLAQPATEVSLSVTAPNGRLVRTLRVPGEAGTIHRVNWDLRHEAARSSPETTTVATMPLPRPPRPIGERGPYVSPGTYTITLEANGVKVSRPVEVQGDPQMRLTLAQHRERETFLLAVLDVQRAVSEMEREAAQLRRDVTRLRDDAPPGSDSRRFADARLDKVMMAERRLRGGSRSIRNRVSTLAGDFNGTGAMQGSFYPPTVVHREVLKALQAELRKARAELSEAALK
jgi:photosystem II stability/assembly factor-like uncharacterized protein